MNESELKPLGVPAVAGPQKPASRAFTRWCVASVVGLVTVGACLLALTWGRYRYQHVMLGDATIRGVVTKVGTRLEGRIQSIEVEVGQTVERGQVLLRLEDGHLRAALDREQSEQQQLTKELQCERLAIEQERRQLSAESERVNGTRKAARGELEARRSHAATSAKHYDRVAALIQSGIAAQSEMDVVSGERDRSQALVQAALGEVEAAESAYQKAMTELEGLRVRETRLGVLESQVRVAEARMAEARANVEATLIRAPESGRVLERIVEVGGSAKVGEPMIALWIGKPWVEGWAAESDLAQIQVGRRAEVALEAFPEKKLAGRVEFIGWMTDKQIQPAAVPATLHALRRPPAMVPVRIALEEEDGRVRLGLSAVVGIRKDSAPATAGRTRLVARGDKDFSEK